MKEEQLRSVIQRDFKDRLLTGQYAVHHVYEGTGRRKNCEKYGFLVALRPAEHAEIHAKPNGLVDMYYKRLCYIYWMKHIGTAEEFRKEFGRTYE